MAGAQAATPDDADKRERSPDHPAFDLELALTKAKMLNSVIGRQSALLDPAKRAMGYENVTSGNAGRCVATLRQFGLLDYVETEGPHKRVKLTDAGYKIVMLQPDNHPDRITLIKAAAIAPRVFHILFNQYQGTLPGADELRNHLVLEQSFSQKTVDKVVNDWKSTYKFAKLGPDEWKAQEAKSAEQEKNAEETASVFSQSFADLLNKSKGEVPKSKELPMPATATPESTRDLIFPVTGGRSVVVRTANIFTKADYALLKTFINAGNDAFVVEPPTAGDDDASKPTK